MFLFQKLNYWVKNKIFLWILVPNYFPEGLDLLYTVASNVCFYFSN